jgi:hypothetical protein
MQVQCDIHIQDSHNILLLHTHFTEFCVKWGELKFHIIYRAMNECELVKYNLSTK